MSRTEYPLPYDRLKHWATQMPDVVYLRQPVNRVYQEKTWSQAHDEVLRLAAALRGLGLQKGDVVAVLGKNTAEWFISDFAIMAAGMISAPIYATAGEDTIRYVLEHSGAKAVFVGKLDDLGPASTAIPAGIITIAQPYDTIACEHQMTDLIAQHEPLAQVDSPSMDDTFSLVYTSGSTGKPKGVVLSYRNIGYAATKGMQNLAINTADRLISYLPLAHITERALIQHVSIQHGAPVSFVESTETFAEDLRNTMPTVFLSVPRLWTKFQSGVLAKMPQKRLSLLLKIPLVARLVRNKIQTQLGLRDARLYGSGTAPISPSLLDWYAKIGINISEGYGMSETTGMVVSQFPYQRDKVGTVGQASEGTELKLAENGELLIRGDGVVAEYYKEPEKTAETFVDGWIHTGDCGEIDAEGYLTITGRVKEIFKTGKGKYVAPVPIESLLLENTDIEQVCVMGYGLPQPVAVVVLSAEITDDIDTVVAGLGNTLKRTNARLESHERISHILVAKDEWTIENALMTPTLKIKRSKLEEKYNEAIAAPHSQPVVVEQ